MKSRVVTHDLRYSNVWTQKQIQGLEHLPYSPDLAPLD
jgi:hypothetical protein